MREHFTALTKLLEKISQVYDQLKTENLWWRGQPEQGLTLRPRVYRNKCYAITEFELISNFGRQAPLRYPAWPQDRSHQLLLMQHYGLPTRLLDWSLGVLTALYFAVSEDKQDKPASLWALNPGKLNQEMTGDRTVTVFTHNEPEIQKMVDLAFQRYTAKTVIGDRVLAMSGPELDLRMLMQWGVYTIHSNDTPINQLVNNVDYIAEIIISEKDRDQLRKALEIVGFSKTRLFPDLQSLADDIKKILKY
ncbi:MAG: FRG domain-containing protein [Syntrophales bacterium]|nr:FRG domain-containing protein [Syntrophales bacterium]